MVTSTVYGESQEKDRATSPQTLRGDSAYAPFGETYASTGTPESSFGGMSQDVLGNGPVSTTPNRTYNAVHGRWLTPDPTTGNIFDPQTLNRYAYVRNNRVRQR